MCNCINIIFTDYSSPLTEYYFRTSLCIINLFHKHFGKVSNFTLKPLKCKFISIRKFLIKNTWNEIIACSNLKDKHYFCTDSNLLEQNEISFLRSRNFLFSLPSGCYLFSNINFDLHIFTWIYQPLICNNSVAFSIKNIKIFWHL